MWAHAERVQNLITDDIEQSRWEMVYPPIRDSISDRPRTDVVAAARRIVSCWQPSVDQLRASGIEPVADLSLRTAPLPDGLSLDLRLERGTDGAVRAYRLTAHRAGVGFKEVSASNAGSYHGPLELSSDWARILDMRVVGILQSPFERRVAVVVGVRRQLVADRSTWIEFMIVGCHLDIGFHP